MDPLLSLWLTELLLRQPDIAKALSELRKPFEHASLSSLLHGLPFPSDSPMLQKLFLLKKLEHEVSQAPVSEATLELVDQVTKLSEEENDDAPVSAAVRRAYSAVVLDCTLRLGRDKEFGEMVKRRMCKNRWVGMKWVDELIADDEAYEPLLRRWEGVSGKNAVFEFVTLEMTRMGPCHLERVANAERENRLVRVQPSRVCLNNSDTKKKRSLQDLKLSARELESEFKDCVDPSLEALRKIPNCGDGSKRRDLTPTPKRRINTSSSFMLNTTDMSPKMGSCKRRRSCPKWTKTEEDMLIIGVNRFKKGHWKEILAAYPYTFIGRTEVDLKDKWMNMITPQKNNMK